MKKSPVITVVAIGIGAALFFVLGRFVSIPMPVIPNTNVSLQYGLLAFMAALFGPFAGALIGLIGHTLIDFTYGSIWWSWVVTSGVVGLVTGLASKKMHLDDGEFSTKDCLWFNLFQVVANAISWGLIAPVLDIVIYAEPANKVFAQGLYAGISNIVTTAVVGTLLCVAYASAKPRKGSLKEEK